ncbi:TBC1 domain family member 15 isoform X2 [Lingula anatina]|uniref:TBC1 domain family member 15 n=1 Tax=Lingula anatina TaxID=7574 RepID=A0A1S3JNQ6_LINAN|nr:TBC1 domain family member 15 isoform X2 [Lingula anatina]|eukprot:XP_013411982.1 TBC1 domain family member 15 isoform X2 [Lingula anatina]
MDDQKQVIYQKDGVYIHTIVHNEDEDALIEGQVEILEKPQGVFIEWRSVADMAAEYAVNPKHEQDSWAVIDAVGYRNESQGSETGSATIQTRRPKQIISFDIKDLKSFKRSKQSLGWSYIIFIQKDGTTHPALHFHKGGSREMINSMERFLSVQRSPNTPGLFLVHEHDPGALSRSFDELQLFKETSQDLVSKFVKDPYSTTLTGFSKVTKFLGEVLMTTDTPPVRPSEEVADILHEAIPGITINAQDEPGFDIVSKCELAERPDVVRSSPLSRLQWEKNMDSEGRIQNVDELQEIIFRGGIEPNLRREVWKFQLQYYDWNSTSKQREEVRKKKVDDYFRMKLQWKSVTEDQKMRFSVLRDRESLIDKDVTRTDRTQTYFMGDPNPKLELLNDILMTYCMYNFDLGYVQGMSDLLAPILVIMDNEVDAFWCFAGFMEIVARNFEMDQKGMKDQLQQLNTLMQLLDPQLYNYLESHESSNMYFCFRWLLILFKREFTFPDIMRLWEVLWTGLPCKNFHLLLCASILDTEKSIMFDNNFGFTEILKHINDISYTIELEPMLTKAEGIYLQLANTTKLPGPIKEILGFDFDRKGSGDSSKTSTPVEGYSTPASTPEHSTPVMSLPLKDSRVGNGGHMGSSSASQETGPTTPDDSSIEILPDPHNVFE